ncbi:MAG: hypothetical protein ACRDTV_02025 [Mycobacterium sp.]
MIAITITRPAWQDNIGYLQPKQTVPYGHSTVVGGVRWQLMSIKPPDKRELQQYAIVPEDLDDYPPNSQLATYVLKRDKDGKPAGLPAGYAGCESAAIAGNRRWSKLSVALSVDYWAQHLGYTTLCSPKYDGPLLVALFVPIGVHISSINIEFLPDSWNDQKQLSKPTDLLVIGFDTD